MSQRYLSFRFGRLTINLLIIFLFGLFFYPGDVSAIKGETPVLKKIHVNDEEKRVRILIEGSSSLSYTIFKLSNPLRVVVDLAGTEAGPFKGKMNVGKDPVIDISTTEKDKPGKLVRIEIGLSSTVDVTPSHQDNKLYIDIQKPSLEKKLETPSVKEEAKKPNETPQEKETKTEVKTPVTKPAVPSQEVKPVPAGSKQGKETTSAVTKDEKPKKSATAVTGVRIDKEKGLRVIISGDGEMKYQAFMLKPNRLVIDIPDTINMARPVTYNVQDPSLSNLRIGQHTEPKKKVRVVLDLTKPLPYEVIKEGKNLIISLKADQPPQEPKATPQKKEIATNLTKKESVAEKENTKEKKESPSNKKDTIAKPVTIPKPVLPPDELTTNPVKKSTTRKEATPIKSEDLIAKVPSLELSPPALAQKMEEPTPPAQKETPTIPKPPEAPEGKYTGRKISLDFHDADIISILRLISEVSGMNIIASPDVKGKITVKLLNVPWDQALDIILKTHHLGKVVEDNIIRVAPVAVLSKERDEIAKAKEAEAKAEDLVSKIIYLGYSKPAPMKDAIEKAKILSPRGNVSIDERTNTLIVKDIAKNLAEAEALIKVIDKPTPQVSIEAKIVEASTSFTKELGIQWGFKNVQSATYGNPLPYTFPHSMTVQGSTLTGGTGLSGNPWAINLPAAVAAGAGGALGVTLGSITNSFTLDLQLSALEGTGQGKILSNPKITTLDNEKAVIKQGKKIPYLTVSAEGTQTSFVDAALSLIVIPTITPGGAISMKIEITKNEADFGRTALGMPTIDTKEASTNVLVKDGETIVIGGIMKTTKSESQAGVPFLHRIPILGWFFKKELNVEDASELLIFITPRIVKPA
jgi:type IV pilus assembly protein PilQ